MAKYRHNHIAQWYVADGGMDKSAKPSIILSFYPLADSILKIGEISVTN